MSLAFRFDPTQGLVIVSARLWGPFGHSLAQLALDTGATCTLINTAKLVGIGFDPAIAPERVRVTTGSGVEYAPRLAIDQIEALGLARLNVPTVCHTLPPSTAVDGLLGLDFLRGQRLTIDFRTGQILVD